MPAIFHPEGNTPFFSKPPPTTVEISEKVKRDDLQENCLTTEFAGAAVVMPHPVK